MKRSMPAMLIALGLAGCAGRPTTYLRLTPTAGTVHHASGPPIAVTRVEMPATIDRMYLTSATGANTLEVSSRARWAAPLSGAARQVLARDLASRLPDRTVLMPGDPMPKDAAAIHVNVTSFLPHEGHVILDADWHVTGAQEEAATTHGRSRIIEPSGQAPAQRARAMSKALGDLADTIAQRISD